MAGFVPLDRADRHIELKPVASILEVPKAETKLTTKTTQIALVAYIADHAGAVALLEPIADALENQDNAPAEAINWGRAGDMTETRRALQALGDRLFAQGEDAG